MPNLTPNLNLKKPIKLTENADIDVINGNMDILDEQINDFKYSVATGTATAIIIPIVAFTDGHSKTFIASENNAGAATTINGKPLYKPNTIISPNLILGKAYTVWYNLSKDCFFIKASAEGNATTNDVLAGKTFSNNDDTALIGILSLVGTAKIEDVMLGKTFYNTDAKLKLNGIATLESLGGKRYKEGLAISSSQTIAFVLATGYSNVNAYSVTVSDLNFKPKIVICYAYDILNADRNPTLVFSDGFYYSSLTKKWAIAQFGGSLVANSPPLILSENGFTIPFQYPGMSVKWIASS